MEAWVTPDVPCGRILDETNSETWNPTCQQVKNPEWQAVVHIVSRLRATS